MAVLRAAKGADCWGGWMWRLVLRLCSRGRALCGYADLQTQRTCTALVSRRAHAVYGYTPAIHMEHAFGLRYAYLLPSSFLSPGFCFLDHADPMGRGQWKLTDAAVQRAERDIFHVILE